jgi:arylformamidase
MNHKDPAWLDSMYNNRTLVPDYASYFDNWVQTSKAVRSNQPCTLDVAYGSAPGEKLDIFAGAAKDAPVLVFIHGGYWRSLDKSDHSFVAPAFTKQGACVVVPNYDLCPAVTIPEITMQVVRALAWTYRNIAQHGGNRKRITVVGHSAGGHLAAMMLACVWKAYAADLPADLVKNALSISGLYDLEPMRHAPNVKDSLKLTPAQVRKASPALLPAPRNRTLFSVAGGIESAEFLRHNQMIQQAWGKKVVPVSEALPGLHHFSVLDALLKPTHRLHQLALKLMVAA